MCNYVISLPSTLTKSSLYRLHSTLTLPMKAMDTARRGLMAKITNVSFHPRTKPMINPVRKAAKNWKNWASFSPIPS